MSQLNLFDLVPPIRNTPDQSLWQKYRIEESLDGVNWSVVEGPLNLVPLVVDPTKPPTYAFSTNDASDSAIYFRVMWIDSEEIEIATPPMMRPNPLPPWAPSLGDVASHIPLRTKIANGAVIGTFTEATKPATPSIIHSLIAKGVKRVRPMFDDPITDPKQAESARDLAALWAAMLTELGLFSDQIENGQSPYTQLKELWDDATGGGDESGGGTDGDDILGRSTRPSWQFEARAPLRW